MGALDFLFEGSPPESVTTAATSTTTLPAWYQEYLRGTMGRATAVAGEEYQPYDQPRIAPLTEDQLAAQQRVRESMGIGGQTAAEAVDIARQASQPFSAGALQTYMSPYTDNVVNRIAELGGRNLREQLLPSVNQTFVGSGQTGSSRHGEFTSRALRDTQEAVLGEQARALESGYGTALDAYEADRKTQLTGASRLGTLGQMQTALAQQDAAALGQVGQQNRDINQANLELAYQDFIEQRDYPREQVRFLNEAVRGFTPPSSTATTNTAPPSVFQPSPLQQIATGAGTALALQDLFAAEGGYVGDRKRGVMARTATGKPNPPKRRYATGGHVKMGALRHAAA